MAELHMPLCIHSEATDPSIDIFDREAACVESTLKPLHADLPDLKIIMEHITTKQGVDFVLNGGPNVGGTITPQHLMYNRNSERKNNQMISRSACRRTETSFLLSTDSETRRTSSSSIRSSEIWMQSFVPWHRLSSSRKRKQRV